MRFALLFAAVILAGIFVWGAVWPRSQWFALVSWTHSDPRATEPSAPAYAAGRFLSAIGALSMLTIAATWGLGGVRLPETQASRAPTVAQQVWGPPAPYVVDRVFVTQSTPAPGLVEQAVDGYQVVDGGAGSPAYLWETGRIRVAGLATQPGFIGVEPRAETVALDTADLVVLVRGDDRCIPQQVVVATSADVVQIGVFFGQPDPADGSNDANVSNCDPSPPAGRTRAFLLPIDLAAEVGGRVVQSLAAVPIDLVPIPTR